MNKIQKKTAIHIYLSTFENESRILKITHSLTRNKIVNHVLILASGREGLEGLEIIDPNRTVFRIRPSFYKNRTISIFFQFPVKIIKLIQYIVTMLKIVRNESPLFINLHQVALVPLIPLFKLISRKSILIYDAHELETETNGLKGIKKTFFKLSEKIFINSFRHIFVVSPSIEEWYQKKYGLSKLTTVLNCPNFQMLEKKDLFRAEMAIPVDAKVYLYQGALFKGRGIELMLDAFKQLDPSKFHVVFMGYGDLKPLIKQHSEKHINIHFKEAVPPETVLQYTASADFGISLIENICLSYYYCLPNKLFEYLMAQLPCIVSNMHEMRQYVKENKVGVVCENMTVKDLIISINQITSFDIDAFRSRLPDIVKKYSWETQEIKLIDVYHRLEAESIVSS